MGIAADSNEGRQRRATGEVDVQSAADDAGRRI